MMAEMQKEIVTHRQFYGKSNKLDFQVLNEIKQKLKNNLQEQKSLSSHWN